MKLYKSPKYFAFLTIGSLLMAFICFSGIFFLETDLTGRIITGAAWSIVTLGWLGQYLTAYKKDKVNK